MTNTATRSYRWLFWTLALVGLALDQGSKYGMFAWLYDGPGRMGEATVVPGVFYFEAKYSHVQEPGDDWRSGLRSLSADYLPEVNHGALWGIGGKDAEGRDFNDRFALVSVVAALLIVLYSLRRTMAEDGWLCLALGLILAGTLGNFYDRLVFAGVRDFLAWRYLYNFPVFNIADSCLVCGATVLLIQAFFAVPEQKASPVAAETAEVNTPAAAQ